MRWEIEDQNLFKSLISLEDLDICFLLDLDDLSVLAETRVQSDGVSIEPCPAMAEW